MTIVKDAVINMIRRLPDDIGIDDIMGELYFMQKVEQGQKELDNGRGITHKKARGRLKKWLD